MKVGVWFYGLGTALTGIVDIVWDNFDPSHEPIKAFGQNVPGQRMLALVAGVWLLTAGLAILSRRGAKIGAATSSTAYSTFVFMYSFRGFTGVHTHGWRIAILSVAFGLAQQLMLIAPAAIIYQSLDSPNSLVQTRTMVAARWLLGLPPIVFGLLHLGGIHLFASIVPHWIPFGDFWAALTGTAFLLAGVAIVSGTKDVLAARLLALMLLLFECLVEVPPIFMRLHDQPTWGAAVFNLTAIGACLIFAESRASSGLRERVDPAGHDVISRSGHAVV